MAKQTINLGTVNGGNGDPLRVAFEKINENFDEVYSLSNIASLSELAQDYAAAMITNATHSGITVVYNDENNTLSFNVVAGDISESLIPDTDVAYDLGSATNRFRDLYLSGSSIDLGGTVLSVANGVLQIGGTSIGDVVKAALTGGGAGTFTDRLEENGDVSYAGLSYTYSSATLAAVQDPDGTSNTMTAQVNVSGDSARLSTVIQTVNGPSVGLVDASPNQVLIRASDDITPPLDWVFTNEGFVFPDESVQTTAYPGIDQDVNTTDNVIFNRVAITQGEINIPIGTDFNLYTSPVSGTSYNLKFNIDGDLVLPDGTKFTSGGNIDHASDQSFTLVTSTTGVDPTPTVWVFTNFYGDGVSSISIPIGEFPPTQLVTESGLGWESRTIEGIGILGGTTPVAVTVDESIQDTIVLTIEGANGAFLLNQSYILVSREYTKYENVLTFDLQGQLSVSGNIAGQDVIVGNDLRIGPAGDWSPIIRSTVNLSNAVAQNLNILSGTSDDTSGDIRIISSAASGITNRGSIYVEANTIYIGSGNSSTVNIGDTSTTTNIYGDLDLTNATVNSVTATLDTDFTIITSDTGIDPENPEVRTFTFGANGLTVQGRVNAGTFISSENMYLSAALNQQIQLSASQGTELSSENRTISWGYDSQTSRWDLNLPGELTVLKITDDGLNPTTRYTTEFIEFQGASQLSMPNDAGYSQLSIDIINNEHASLNPNDITVVFDGTSSQITTPVSTNYNGWVYTDRENGGTNHSIFGYTDNGNGTYTWTVYNIDLTGTIIELQGYLDDFIIWNPSAIDENTVHSIRVDGNGNASGFSTFEGVRDITGVEDEFLYLSTVNGPATSSNIVMTSVGGVRNTLNGTTGFGNGATVDFTGATVTGLTAIQTDGSNLFLGYQTTASNVYIGTGGLGKTTRLESDRLQILSNAPTSSKGTSGDNAGMVAFDANYIYYCTGAYVAVTWANSATVDVAGGGTGGSGIALNLTTVPSTGWYLSDGTSALAQITQVVPQGNFYVLIFDQEIAFNIGDTVYYGETAPVQADIWKRVAWSSDTW